MVRGGGHRTGGDAAAAADIYSLCVYYYTGVPYRYLARRTGSY
jgi:hypothetical protein